MERERREFSLQNETINNGHVLFIKGIFLFADEISINNEQQYVEFLDTLKTYNQTFEYERRKRFGYVHNHKFEEFELEGGEGV